MGIVRMKIQIPRRRPDILRRQRLIDFLTTHRDQKLLLLCTPAGYGKTTLLVDYASDPGYTVCWYSLEETDRDPMVFLRYLTESIRLRFPQFGEQTLSMLQVVSSAVADGDTLPARDRSRAIAETLLNELYETVTEPFAIVLNDYHLAETPQINHLMGTLLRYLPDNGQFIVLSREVPALDLPRLAARREVAGLGIEELRFTAAEIAAFLHQSGSREGDEQVAQALVERFNGWITGIILGTKELAQGLLPQTGSGAATDNTQLFAYLAMEVLEQQSPAVQRFLLDTSVLSRLSAPLCNALLECDDAQSMLNQVEAKRLFLERVGGDRSKGDRLGQERRPLLTEGENHGRDNEAPWYRYHELFRDFLRDHLRAHDPERMEKLCRRAAEIFVEMGEPGEAIAYFLAAGAYERAVQLIEAARRELVAAGQLEISDRWLAQLPSALLGERPGLLLLQARIACRTGKPDQALELTRRTETLATEQHNVSIIVEALLEQGIVLSWLGRHAEAIPLCHQALGLLAGPWADDARLRQLLMARAHCCLSTAFYHCAELAAAREQLLQALCISREHGDMIGMAITHHGLGIVLHEMAEDSAAEYHLHEAIQVWTAIGRPRADHEVPQVLNELAVLYQYQGRYELALQTLREAEEILNRTNDTRVHGYVVGTMADIQRDMGQRAQAQATYETAWSFAEQAHETHLSFWIALGRAENCARAGELGLAREFLAQAQQFLPDKEEQERHNWGAFYLTQTLIASQEQNLPCAITCARRAQVLFHTNGWIRAWSAATMRLAALLWRQGMVDEAVQVMAELLDRVDPAQASLSLWQVFQVEVQGWLPVLHTLLASPQELPDTLLERARWLDDWSRAQDMPSGGESEPECASQRARQPVALSSVADVGSFPEHCTGRDPVVAQGLPVVVDRSSVVFHIFAFGEPRVYINDRLVTEWRSAKALELLLYFVESRSARRKEVVLEALWPEASFQRADVLFRSTMYRLRQAIGQDCIVYRRGIYSLELSYTYDVRDFEAALAEARQLEAAALDVNAPPPAAAIAAYRRAIELYGGDYCEPLYADWCSQRRDALRQAYIEALLRLARAEWDAGRLDESATLWQRLLIVDNCAEEAHRGLMIYYAARGQRVMAVRQYQRCLRALEELDVPPSAETIATYRRAVGQESPVRLH